MTTRVSGSSLVIHSRTWTPRAPDDHVGHELLARADRLLSIASDTDAVHVTFGVHEIAQVLADRRMIVDDEDADHSPKHLCQFRRSKTASHCRLSIDTVGRAA